MRYNRSSGSGLSHVRAFRIGYGIAEDWAHAAQACVNGLGDDLGDANLGFLYITDHLADDVASILAYVRQKTGIERWVGSVGMGVCAGGNELFDRPAVAAMAGSLPEGSFCIFPAISRDTAELSEVHRAWIADAAPTFGIVHGDPGNPNIRTLISDLADRTSGFLVGGLTSSRGACHQIAGRMTGGGLSGILFTADVTVHVGLSQGCAPVGDSHIVSDCVDNILIGLDGRRALDVFKEDVGEVLARDLKRAAGYIHAALPLPGCDTGDFMVRSLLAVDPVHGWIAIGDRVQPGDRVLFVRRDSASARDDLAEMVAGLKARAVARPRGGVYFSCVARGENMFGTAGSEMAIIRNVLGDLPVVGFYCGGEISNGRLYGFTGVLALFA